MNGFSLADGRYFKHGFVVAAAKLKQAISNLSENRRKIEAARKMCAIHDVGGHKFSPSCAFPSQLFSVCSFFG